MKKIFAILMLAWTSMVFSKEVDVAYIPWHTTSKTIYIRATEDIHAERGPARTLYFYDEHTKNPVMETSDFMRLVAAFTLRKNSDCLVVVYISGSAYLLEVYQYSKGKILNVLSDFSKGIPHMIPRGLCPDLFLQGHDEMRGKIWWKNKYREITMKGDRPDHIEL